MPQWVLDVIKNEWRVVKGAPYSVGSLCVATAVVIGGVMFGTIVAGRDGAILQKDAEISTLKSALSGKDTEVSGKNSTIELLREQVRAKDQRIAELSPRDPRQTVSAAPSARTITSEARDLFRRQILAGAKAVIAPDKPGEPESFARELARALTDAGVDVKIKAGNFIMNGSTGLIVQYDYSDPVSKSVVETLRHAHLEPQPSGDMRGNPVVNIRVAPQAD